MISLESFMIDLQWMLCVCSFLKSCMFYALWLFVDAKGGEKIGIKSRTHIIK